VNRRTQERTQTAGTAGHESMATAATAAVGAPGPARILVVGGEPDFRASLVRTLNARRHRCTHLNRLDEARTATGKQRYDLILVHPTLPDGDGLEFAQGLQRTAPATKTIIFSETGSFKIALSAMRCGAVDFIHTPADQDEFVARIDAALVKRLAEIHREQRIRRLQGICRELHEARAEIADQVDVLCNDLAAAYQDLTDQISEAAMTSEFRTLLRQELDMEEALRTTLEYLLGKTGPTNAAVFLPDADHLYSLGAYVNYDCPRESIDTLLDHLCDAVCPQMSDETEIVAFDDASEFADWIGLDDECLGSSQVIAFSCRHHGECLAVMVLFRNREQPFDPKLAGTLDILRTIFAEQLSQIIRIHHRATPEWPMDAHEDDFDWDDDMGFGGGLAA